MSIAVQGAAPRMRANMARIDVPQPISTAAQNFPNTFDFDLILCNYTVMVAINDNGIGVVNVSIVI